MAFFSLLYPTPASKAQTVPRTWLDYRMEKRKGGEAFVVRGNKIFAAPKVLKSAAPIFPGLYLDLNMDQIMEAVLCRDTDEELKEMFFQFCPDDSVALYRHGVMKALEEEGPYYAFQSFQQSMLKAERLMDYGKRVHHAAQRDKYMVDGACMYCSAVFRLLEQTGSMTIMSRGLLDFLNALCAYAKEDRFIALDRKTKEAREAVDGIRYGLRVTEGTLYVDFEPEKTDMLQSIVRDFQAAEDFDEEPDEKLLQIRLFPQPELSPLEALIMDALENKYGKEFQMLHTAAGLSSGMPEPFIGRFLHELRFYFRYLDMMNSLRSKGLPFAYPSFTQDETLSFTGAYDLALAISKQEVVANDLSLSADERGVIVTGANQGGKTTFARSIGQIAVLAVLGLPVPCKSASLKLYKSIFSKFTEPEDSSVDNGKLKEELLRLKPILRMTGRDSLVILNELFSSATPQDAMDMAHHTLTQIMDASSHVICVTHIASLTESRAVSMVAQVHKEDGRRLYAIFRAPSDGLAYANSIAAKYHLTFQEIRERISHGI